MTLLLRNHYFLFLMLGLYYGCSSLVFDKVYNTIKIVVDELFHIPQAKAYCNGKFNQWNPKITTLPGLYIAAANTVGLIAPCDTYNLRFFNLIVSTINMVLFYIILDIVYGQNFNRFKITSQALNIAILPPLYFFSHVFYTDTVALMCLLLYTICVIKRVPYLIIVFGMFSIFARQTNFVWLIMVSSQKFLEKFLKSSRVYGNRYIEHRLNPINMEHELDPTAIKRIYNFWDMFIALRYHSDTMLNTLMYYLATDLDNTVMLQMWVPNTFFFLFVYINGSIVVGDKSAHTMTINIPQLFYFLLFYGFFGLPFVLARFKSTVRFMRRRRHFVVLVAMVAFLAVHFNTVVHPYLLADNRHYTFYIWNRWFGKYPEAAYLMLPVYVFLTCSLMDNLNGHNCISFLFAYYTLLLPAVCLQRLLEIRYFIFPYIIARLRFPRSSDWVVVFEFFWYVAINVATFYIFFTKEIKWTEYAEPQRIIW